LSNLDCVCCSRTRFCSVDDWPDLVDFECEFSASAPGMKGVGMELFEFDGFDVLIPCIIVVVRIAIGIGTSTCATRHRIEVDRDELK